MDELENKPQDENVEPQEGQETPESKVPQDERPEINYKAELERKNKVIEQLRKQAESVKPESKRDANDISTWSDMELKAIANSNDPNVLPYKDQATDILIDRKVERVHEKRRLEEKRALSEIELRNSYPDALDPTSPLASKMEEVMQMFDLQKSPAGRLAAAKIAASDLGLVKSKKTALDREQEAKRVADVKGQMVDGDRSKPTESNHSPRKQDELKERINAKNINESAEAMGELLKQRGLTPESFFKR